MDFGYLMKEQIIPRKEESSETREEQKGFSRPAFDSVMTERVYNIIREHDSTNPISGREIGRELGISDVQVRSCVHHLRLTGTGKRIASVPNYFIARDESEMKATVDMMRGRTIEELRILYSCESAFDKEDNQITMNL